MAHLYTSVTSQFTPAVDLFRETIYFEIHVYKMACEHFVPILVIEDVEVVYGQEISGDYGYLCHPQDRPWAMDYCTAMSPCCERFQPEV